MAKATATRPPADFLLTDVRFMSAHDKALILKDWLRFLKNGLAWTCFTKRLYRHLHLHCSFIAHFDRHGFYDTYFTTGDETVVFLRQFDHATGAMSAELGPNGHWLDGDYRDVNTAMLELAEPFLPALYARALHAQETRDVATANRLLAKHGRAAVA